MSASKDPIAVGAGKKAGGNKRLMTLAGVGVGLLLLVLVVPKVLGGGSGSDSGGAEALNGAAPAKTTATTLPPVGSPAVVKSTKNPFVPLLASSSGGDPTSITDPGVISVVDPVGPGASTPYTPADPGSGTSSGTSVTGIRLGLLEIFDSGSAWVQVNDEKFQVAVNDTFAGSYRVVWTDVPSRCGKFVYGDRVIALCEGEEAIV
jgi:hypothetical protein